MNFRKITDALFASVGHQDLAKALGVSVASIRQARLDEGAQAHRTPPKGWEKAVRKLAEDRVRHYQRLAEQLEQP